MLEKNGLKWADLSVDEKDEKKLDDKKKSEIEENDESKVLREGARVSEWIGISPFLVWT